MHEAKLTAIFTVTSIIFLTALKCMCLLTNHIRVALLMTLSHYPYDHHELQLWHAYHPVAPV